MGDRINSTNRSVVQISIGRFHHFHLARQLEKHGLLKEIWTGYPRFALKSEQGIPRERIRTFPWLKVPHMAAVRLGVRIPAWLENGWNWLCLTALDDFVSKQIQPGSVVIALSGSGLKSGKLAKSLGGTYYCDRGSSHIRFQDRILREEYARWKLPFGGIDPRLLAREEAEYEAADYVSVPSSFVLDSFLEMGYPREKLFLNPYGARLERFFPVAKPERDMFTILFVGAVSIQKGFLYLLDAFNQIKHPNKRLKVLGSVEEVIKPLLKKFDLANAEFLGNVANDRLPLHYSSANVIVLPSVQEGFGMVIGEALACGCPVIASEHTGARDFFTDGVEGFIVPPRSIESLVHRLEQLAEDNSLRLRMSQAALNRVKAIGGWAGYGNRWFRHLEGVECD